MAPRAAEKAENSGTRVSLADRDHGSIGHLGHNAW